MFRSALFLSVVLGAVCALGACSKSPANANAGTPSHANVAAVPAGTACDRKLLTAQDLDGIFSDPLTPTRGLKGDPQTCYMVPASQTPGGPQLMTSLRPGYGLATLGSFSSGMMKDYATWKPLGGVGDEAIWRTDMVEITARKDDLLCEISVGSASPGFYAAAEEIRQKKLGALCNKIFAAN